MMQRSEFSQEGTESDVEPLSPEEQQRAARRKKSKNKRRFSDEQVRSLEKIFASERKLEQKKKVQVARELGLQPRQVAIWFQNKRARWKSKQIEKNYRTLKANCDNLKTRFDSIRKENESLVEQVQELRRLLEKSHDEINGCKDSVSREERDSVAGLTVKSSTLQEEMEQGVIYSDDDKSGNMAYLGNDEPELMNICQNREGSIISPVKWCSFDAGNLFDQTSTSSHWWDSWT